VTQILVSYGQPHKDFIVFDTHAAVRHTSTQMFTKRALMSSYFISPVTWIVDTNNLNTLFARVDLLHSADDRIFDNDYVKRLDIL